MGAGLILQFSELQEFWKKTYQLAIHFDEVPGLHPGSPVKQNGITIGNVREIMLDQEAGGVLVVVEIQEKQQLRADARPRVAVSLFGDSRIEFTSGKSQQVVPPQSRLRGEPPTDPLAAVERLEHTVNTTLGSFEKASQEWQLLARNVNNIVDTKRGSLDDVVERTATALDNFNRTMNLASGTFADAGKALNAATTTLTNANSLIADPQLQQNLRETAASLPRIAQETRDTIAAARASMQLVSQNLNTIQQATLPIADQSDVIVRKLAGSLIQLESLLTELNKFSVALNTREGSLQQLAADPALYRNLNRSSAELSALLQNLGPIMKDVQIFSDKVARHPEILGVSGAMRGSTGIKGPADIEPAAFNAPANPRDR